MSALPDTSAAAAPTGTSVDRVPSARDELAARREAALFERCRAGDPEARAQLVECFLPLAASMARRYEASGEAMDDLIQVACLGLVKAVDRFDADKGVRFSSYAVPTILGELKRYFRDRTWAVHVPRSLNELALRLDKAVADLTRTTGHAPSLAQLAETLDVSEELVLEAMDAGRARRIGSLDASPSNLEDAGSVGDSIASVRAARDQAEADDRLLLHPLLATLTPRDRRVLQLRFQEDLTQAEIGELVGVSQMQVSRIIRNSLDRLRAVAVPQP